MIVAMGLAHELRGLLQMTQGMPVVPPPAAEGSGSCGLSNSQLGSCWESLLGSSGSDCACPCSSSPCNDSVQVPSMHYIAIKAPACVNQQHETWQGADGKIDQLTQYTNAKGKVVFTDKGVYDPSTGVLRDVETNSAGQRALVTSRVKGNHIISHVSGNSNVSTYEITFNKNGTNTQTAWLNNGTSYSMHQSHGHTSPWTTFDLCNGPVTSNFTTSAFSSGNGAVTALNLTNPEDSYVSTLL